MQTIGHIQPWPKKINRRYYMRHCISRNKNFNSQVTIDCVAQHTMQLGLKKNHTPRIQFFFPKFHWKNSHNEKSKIYAEQQKGKPQWGNIPENQIEHGYNDIYQANWKQQQPRNWFRTNLALFKSSNELYKLSDVTNNHTPKQRRSKQQGRRRSLTKTV